ncbi:MAG: hypothetical protein K1X57_15335 [Gemmataceae bacterium]|nr:hypothetical protein [Gemmataceae bacterium]
MILPLLLLAGLGADLGELQAAVDRDPASATAWLALAQEYDTRGQEAEALRAFTRAGTSAAAREALGRYTAGEDPAKAAEHYLAAAGIATEPEMAERCRIAAIRLTGDPRQFRLLLDREPTPAVARCLMELMARCGSRAEWADPLDRWVFALPEEPGPLAAWALVDRSARAVRRVRARLTDRPSADLVRAAILLPSGDVRRSSAEQCWDLLSANESELRAFVGGMQAEPGAVADWICSLPTTHGGGDRGSAYARPIIAMHLAAQTDQLELVEKVLREVHVAGGRQSLDVAIALLFTWERMGRHEAADAEARRLLANPETVLLPHLYRARARAMMHVDRKAEARTAAADAVRTAGGRSAIGMRLLEIETRVWFGQDDEAKALARKLLEEYPKADDERMIRLRLAAIVEHGGDPDAAERHLLRILELFPKDAGTHNNLGYYFAERGRRLDEAEHLCRFAVGAGRQSDGYDPGGDDPSYRDSLGWTLFQRGRLRAAQAELEHALRLPGGRTDAVIWDHLGDVYAARGWPDKARGAWTEALARIDRSVSRRNDPRPAELRRKLAARTKE